MCTTRTNDTAWFVWAYAVCLLCQSSALAQCEIAKIVAPDGAAGDLFGYSATMNEVGMFVGAVVADNREENAGAVYAVGPNGIQQEMLASFGRGFGRSVDVNGARLLVGATGAAYASVLEPDDAETWTFIAQFRSDDWQSGDGYGWSVGLSGDTAAVGAYNESNENGGEAGSAYVFERDPNGAWCQTQKLVASDGHSNAEFGESVAIDGNVIVVGAWRDWSGAQYAGKAYIYEYENVSSSWVETARLLPPTSHTFQDIGTSVAVQGNVVLVGAEGDYAAEDLSGAVYVYERDPDGVWSLSVQLKAGDPQVAQSFGCSVEIQGDRLLVGARHDDNPGASNGAAYLFLRESDGVWRQHAKLIASDGAAYAEFGYSVALDGSWALIGTPYDDDLGLSSGSAYIFRVGHDWSGNGVPDICECPGDIDYSGAIDLADLSALLTHFGFAAGQSYESGDIDGDYAVDLADFPRCWSGMASHACEESHGGTEGTEGRRDEGERRRPAGSQRAPGSAGTRDNQEPAAAG